MSAISGPVERPGEGSGSRPGHGRKQVKLRPASDSCCPACPHLCRCCVRFHCAVGAGRDVSFEGFEGGGLEGQEEGVVRSWVKGE